jgi:ribosome-associated protein
MIEITPSISIGENEIVEQFIRSPGSGGQKVNKTESAVQLRFDARMSPALSNAVFLSLKALSPDFPDDWSISLQLSMNSV